MRRLIAAARVALVAAVALASGGGSYVTVQELVSSSPDVERRIREPAHEPVPYVIELWVEGEDGVEEAEDPTGPSGGTTGRLTSRGRGAGGASGASSGASSSQQISGSGTFTSEQGGTVSGKSTGQRPSPTQKPRSRRGSDGGGSDGGGSPGGGCPDLPAMPC